MQKAFILRKSFASREREQCLQLTWHRVCGRHESRRCEVDLAAPSQVKSFQFEVTAEIFHSSPLYFRTEVTTCSQNTAWTCNRQHACYS